MLLFPPLPHLLYHTCLMHVTWLLEFFSWDMLLWTVIGSAAGVMIDTHWSWFVIIVVIGFFSRAAHLGKIVKYGDFQPSMYHKYTRCVWVCVCRLLSYDITNGTKVPAKTSMINVSLIYQYWIKIIWKYIKKYNWIKKMINLSFHSCLSDMTKFFHDNQVDLLWWKAD